jgi:hypothetical protein
MGMEGVSGLKLGFSMVERLKLWANDGVVGEGGKSDESAEARFCARCIGRKMPEPGTEVRKYCVLHRNQYRRNACYIAESVPVNSAVILAPRRILSAQLHAGEDTLLATDASHELDDTVHAAGHIHQIADADVPSVCAHSRRW